MNQTLTAKLQQISNDYTSVTSRSFQHFYCPILYKDELAELCRAHIVNQAFPNASKEWTIQRKDVDNFFGSHFEADFTIMEDVAQNEEDRILSRAFAEKGLYKKFKPKIWVNDQEVEYFFAEGKTPDSFTPLKMIQINKELSLALKIDPKDFAELVDANWEVGISKDIRLHALVSLIKAAHLSMFHTLGYRYALTAAANFIGYNVLGQFFLRNNGLPRQEVLKNAANHFASYTHLTRPIFDQGLGLAGTITDNRFFLCRRGSIFWAFIVIVNTGNLLNGVLLPIWEDMNAIKIFLDFLSNETEEITVSLSHFKGDRIETDKNTRIIMWPKGGNIGFE